MSYLVEKPSECGGNNPPAGGQYYESDNAELVRRNRPPVDIFPQYSRLSGIRRPLYVLREVVNMSVEVSMRDDHKAAKRECLLAKDTKLRRFRQ